MSTEGSGPSLVSPRADSVTPPAPGSNAPNGSLAYSGTWAPNCSLAVSSEAKRAELFSDDEFAAQMAAVALYEAILNSQQEDLARNAFDALRRRGHLLVSPAGDELVSFMSILNHLHPDDGRRFHELRASDATLTLTQFSSLVDQIAKAKMS
jgi:hypothetical protein